MTEPTFREPVAAPLTTMLAMVQDEYGEAERVLRPERIDRPSLGDGEVLVRVSAAGVDRGVWHQVAGLPYPIRLAGFGLRAPKNRVPGMDVAGRVEAVGPGVTKLHVGDEVFGAAAGSFAEYARAKAELLTIRPQNITAEQAAAVPVSATTALKAVRDRGQVQPGHKVLVLGASGGVGTFAVQIAKSFGAEVTGVASASKTDLVAAIGADHVLDYTTTEITETGERYDVILDVGGNRPLRTLRRALTPRGTLVITGGETDGRWLGGTDRQVRAMLLSPFVRQRLGTFISTPNAADLAELRALLEAGTVVPVIDRSMPLVEAAAAIRHLQAGRARGKVVLTV
jgi:NADPH:quinone reductase-like Zn-dependent oxidoreductase